MNLGMLLPVAVVAAILAYFYGRTIGKAWLPAIITFACVLLSGILFGALGQNPGVGQIVGVVLSALLIFFLFALPEQRRIAKEQAKKEASDLPNEEDT